MIDLRLGRWQDVLSDVECDALITDPPYSDRTHEGTRSANAFRQAEKRTDRIRNQLPYERIDEAWARDFVRHFAPRFRDWFVVFGDHISSRWWESAMREEGLLTFAPVPWVRTNAPPRFQGDGPQNSCEWITIGRPRRNVRDRGSRRGFYMGAIEARDQVVVGGKPLWLTRAIVADYSMPGDLICDPCAGGATTLIAAASEKRRAVGAEMDPDTYAKALARVRDWEAEPLFTRPDPDQLEMQT